MTEDVKDNDVVEDVADAAEDVVEGVASKVEDVESKAKASVTAVGESLNEAIKQVEKQVGNISKALGSALQDRANVVMVRVNDDSLRFLDVLIEADITKSRSESAAFLINEGIKANAGLFNKIGDITDQIAALKSQLKESVNLK
jgi:hypothetical protein